MLSLRGKIFEEHPTPIHENFWCPKNLENNDHQSLIDNCRDFSEMSPGRAYLEGFEGKTALVFIEAFLVSVSAFMVLVGALCLIYFISEASLSVLRAKKGKNRLIRVLWKMTTFALFVTAAHFIVPLLVGIIVRGLGFEIFGSGLGMLMIFGALLLLGLLADTEDDKKDVMLVGGEPFDPGKEEVEVEATVP